MPEKESRFPVVRLDSLSVPGPPGDGQVREVTGKPVFHLLLKPFILRTPKRWSLEPMRQGGIIQAPPSSWKVFPSFPPPPGFFFSFPFFSLAAPFSSTLSHQVPASKFFPAWGRSFQPRDTQMTHRRGSSRAGMVLPPTLAWVPDTGRRQCLALNT